MKKIAFLLLSVLLALAAFAQKPSKAQMDADKKRLAEAMKELEETRAKMSPEARKNYDSVMNLMGMGQKMNDALNKVNTNSATPSVGLSSSNGSIPARNNPKIAAIAATPSNAAMGASIKNANSKTLPLLLPMAQQEGKNIYDALKAKKVPADEMGQAANLLWISGKTQVAFYIMARVCSDDPTNTDNLNNYASMLHTLDAPQLAIPVLNNLNARFRNNSTILNNLGQAWFALGEISKADKYLDSAILISAYHPQANFTKCLIDESRGNKAAAIAHGRAAMKGGYSKATEDKLKQLGYTPTGDDFSDLPGYKDRSKDLLNLAGFQPPPFPKNAQESEALEPVWKEYKNDIEGRISPLEKQAQEYNKTLVRSTEEKIKKGMAMRNKAIANPGSVSQAEAMALADAPVFAARMMYKQKLVLENLARKRNELAQKLRQFYSGEGAAMENKYKKQMEDIAKNAGDGEGGTSEMTTEQLCKLKTKATNDFLASYNGKLEELFHEYLAIEKQYYNELAYTNLYTTYPEANALANAGLKVDWLRDIKASDNFNFKSIKMPVCADPVDPPGKGKLQEFKDPNCDINSSLNWVVGSITVTCSGVNTKLNLGAFGIEVNQNLNGASFGDSFENCTVSIGPKAGAKANLGPLQVKAEAGAGVNVTIDRSGVSDITLTAGAEAGAGIGGSASASGGIEGSISLNSGQGSIAGTGVFSGLK